MAAAVFAAVRERDWPRFAALLDHDAAEEFKQEQRAIAVMTMRFASASSETSSGTTRNTGDEAGGEPSLLRHVFKTGTLEAFDALSGKDVVLRFMRVKDRGARAPTGPPVEEHHVVLGFVEEDGQFAHVVVRTMVRGGDASSLGGSPLVAVIERHRSWVDVLTLRKTAAGWRSRLNGGLITSGGGGFSIGYDRTDDDQPDASA